MVFQNSKSTSIGSCMECEGREKNIFSLWRRKQVLCRANLPFFEFRGRIRSGAGVADKGDQTFEHESVSQRVAGSERPHLKS
ncbi:unnamed protein product [Larinioides sclopetarius]|uniref:Uncharacterized protein n=1 Tax=Larinioides sclopetarius TaxID=280406 RepID=A0AAV2BFP2_9ARAC